MTKNDVYQKELMKLHEIFQDIDQNKAKLAQGLIEDAAFLYAENFELKRVIDKTGMVKFHPDYPEIQKPTEAAKQYLKNANSYAVIIKALNGILNKSLVEEDDDLEEFE